MKLNKTKHILVFIMVLSVFLFCFVSSYQYSKTTKANKKSKRNLSKTNRYSSMKMRKSLMKDEKKNEKKESKKNEKKDSKKNKVKEVKLSQKEIKSKNNFKLFEAMRYLAITSHIFKPMEFMFNKYLHKVGDGNSDRSNTKCGHKHLHNHYIFVIRDSMLKIKEFKLTDPFKARLEKIVERCSEFLKNRNNLADSIKKLINKDVDDTEKKESLVSHINEAKDCIITFKEYKKLANIDTSEMKPPCKILMQNLGCDTKTSEGIKSCLTGPTKDKKNNKKFDDPVEIATELASIQTDPNKEKTHKLIQIMQKKMENLESCKIISNPDVVKAGKRTSPLRKFVVRLKAILVVFNELIKCKGISKPFLDSLKNADEGSMLQLIINFLTLNDLPKTALKRMMLIGGFTYHTINYFIQKQMAVGIHNEKKNMEASTKHFILMSRHFGAAAGYLLRCFINLFDTEWDDIFKKSIIGNKNKIADIKIDGVKVFDDWNFQEKRKRMR